MRKERQELPPVTTHRQCSGQDWVVRGATCLALLREERTLYKRREFDGFSHLERKLSTARHRGVLLGQTDGLHHGVGSERQEDEG